jgi:hypothetical protein
LLTRRTCPRAALCPCPTGLPSAEDDGCKIALVDQPDVELKCVGKEGHVPNETIVDGQTYCGGIPLKKGLCLVPAHGTFTKMDSSQVCAVHMHARPRNASTRGGGVASHDSRIVGCNKQNGRATPHLAPMFSERGNFLQET